MPTSVLMPVRDAARWLGEAVDSILAQTDGDWELIAVDDGSCDGSRDLLEAYARIDGRVRVLTTGAGSRGIVAALNLGLAAARYPFVARMDADDVAHPQRLARQLEMLAAHPSLFAVGCVVEAFPATSCGAGMHRYLAWQNSLLTPWQIARDRFIECPVLHPSLLLRTQALRERLGGWRARDWAEDWDLLLRACEAGLAFGRHRSTLLRWRLHERQATRCDGRYSASAFVRARAHYLARRLAARTAECGPLWVMGAGPIGKTLGKALAAEGVALGGFVDLDPRKIGGRIRQGRRSWPVIGYGRLRTLAPRPFAVAAVGVAGARDLIRSELASWGWSETEDYLVAA